MFWSLSSFFQELKQGYIEHAIYLYLQKGLLDVKVVKDSAHVASIL